MAGTCVCGALDDTSHASDCPVWGGLTCFYCSTPKAKQPATRQQRRLLGGQALCLDCALTRCAPQEDRGLWQRVYASWLDVPLPAQDTHHSHGVDA